MNIEIAFKEYQEYSIIKKRKATVKYQLHQVKALNKIFKELKIYNIEDIKETDIINIIKISQRNCCNATINKRLKHLKLVLNYNNINLKITMLKEDYKTFQVFTEEEIKTILQFIEKLPNDNYNLTRKLIIRLLFDSGVRQSELLNIKRENIDIKNNRILLVDTKTRAERYIFFTKYSKKCLESYLKRITVGNYLLFNVKTNTKYNYRHLEALCRYIEKNTGVKRVHAHKFRHTLATLLVENDCPLYTVKMILGHKSLKTTERYLHCSVKKAQENYNKYIGK